MDITVEPKFSKEKQTKINDINNIILEKYGLNCGVECIDIMVTKEPSGKRIRKKIIITLRRTSGCKSTRKVDQTSLTKKGQTLDIMNRYDLCDDETCVSCEEQSCVELSREYQNNRTLYPSGGIWNEGVNGHPRRVKKNSSSELTFTCVNPLCYHSYKISPSKILNAPRDPYGIRGCTFCSRSAKTLCGDRYCIPCENKSLTSRQNIMKVWSSKNTTPPYAIMKTSRQDIWLECHSCNGEPYLRNIGTINNTCELLCESCKTNSIIRRKIYCIECNSQFMRTKENQTKCSCCRGVNTPSIPLCSNNNCKSCYERSFAKRIKEEDIGSLKFREDLNERTPRDIARKSGQEYKFECDLCNEIVSLSLNKQIVCCPCSGKFTTENHIRNKLSDIHDGKPFTKTRSLKWLIDDKTGNLMELDGYNEELKIAFEYQGKQHYELTYHNQHNKLRLEDIKRKDELKSRLCYENNVKLIIVSCDMSIPEINKYLISQSVVKQDLIR
jgi:hypothetical protein